MLSSIYLIIISMFILIIEGMTQTLQLCKLLKKSNLHNRESDSINNEIWKPIIFSVFFQQFKRMGKNWRYFHIAH